MLIIVKICCKNKLITWSKRLNPWTHKNIVRSMKIYPITAKSRCYTFVDLEVVVSVTKPKVEEKCAEIGLNYYFRDLRIGPYKT